MNMPGDNHKPPMTGEQVAINMLSMLSTISAQLEANAKLHAELLGKMDDLIGHFEVIDMAMEILLEMKDKQNLNMKDFARAWREAADEIFGEDEDDPNEGDVLTEARR